MAPSPPFLVNLAIDDVEIEDVVIVKTMTPCVTRPLSLTTCAFAVPVVVPHITGISADCAAKHIIVTGTNFLTPTEFTLTAPDGSDSSPAIISHNSTTIVVQPILAGGNFVNGNYCAQFRNTDPVDGFMSSYSNYFCTDDDLVCDVVTELSGIYFVNPINTHDKYNGPVDKKIPNPTIKTAFIGE
jgi:hypothetical protein